MVFSKCPHFFKGVGTLSPILRVLGRTLGFYAYAIIVHTRANELLPQLLMEQFDTLPIQYRHIEHMHAGVWFKKMIFDKMTSVRT